MNVRTVLQPNTEIFSSKARESAAFLGGDSMRTCRGASRSKLAKVKLKADVEGRRNQKLCTLIHITFFVTSLNIPQSLCIQVMQTKWPK